MIRALPRQSSLEGIRAGMYDKPRIRRVRFYKNDRGNPVAREEFYGLNEAGQAALADLFCRYEHGLERPGEVKALGGGLLEFRTCVRNNPFRAYFFHDGSKYAIILVCVYKNQQKARKTDLDLARARMKAWQGRGT